MKKTVALFLVLIFIFTGCSVKNKSLGISEAVITDTEILKMKITDASATQIAVEIVNTSKCDVGYDEYYTIEFEDKGEWLVLKPKHEVSFIEIGYILEKESTCTWGDKLERIYGKLPEGKYRIIKNFTIFERESDTGENCTLAAQFRVG